MKLFITITLLLFHFLNCAFENTKETPEPSKPETTQDESEIKKNGFNETVILKNGTVLNGVKSTPTKESQKSF